MRDKPADPFLLLTSAAVEGMLRQLSRLGCAEESIGSIVVIIGTTDGVYTAGYGCGCPGCEQELREALGRFIEAQRDGGSACAGAVH